jgi:cell division protein ZapA
VKEKTQTITVNILDKDYQIACPPEQQAELVDSAKYLDAQMRKIRGNGKVVGLERIAVMAALNIAHELRHAPKPAQEAATSPASTEQVKRLNNKLDSALVRLQQLEL